jgi:hypothetical protein
MSPAGRDVGQRGERLGVERTLAINDETRHQENFIFRRNRTFNLPLNTPVDATEVVSEPSPGFIRAA